MDPVELSVTPTLAALTPKSVKTDFALQVS